MEDVLDVYQRPLDPKRPLVCLDEASKQLLSDLRPATQVMPGQPARQDREYKRNGTANLFMVCAPLLVYGVRPASCLWCAPRFLAGGTSKSQIGVLA